jgi:acyl transferase domain-containing protein/NADP-dependent 3-hydroxy acid dehydrogenase YdfG
MFMCFSKTPAMSASGHCRPFSQSADGTMMGEGGGMLSLRRLEDAERDGDAIYAVIRGLGSSSDGRSKSVYAPRPEGQSVALQRCYVHAGYSPATVRLVEAHGTGTAAGDMCEATALKEVFAAADAGRRQWCALGSVKSQIGHTKGAAGTAGMVKVALALRHQAFPPTANIDAPNPEMGFGESPLYLNTKARPWIQASGEPRRGSVSSFGFGGTNFHVALEEYRGASPAPRVRAFGVEVFLASAANATELATRVAAWTKLKATEFVAAARTSQQGFDAAAVCRVAVVAASEEDLATKTAKLIERLADTRAGVKPAIDGVHVATEARAADGAGLVYLFPGQGSQSVGMAGEVPMQFEPAMQQWEKVESLGLLGGERLCDIVYPPPAMNEAESTQQDDRLRRTENAQPALGAVSLGYLAVLEAAGLRPEMVGGHSFGEIPALYAAGAISWKDCMRISRERGELMAEVSRDHDGAMTAVWHPVDELTAMLTGECAACVIANQNSPQQSVVAGPTEQIGRLEGRLTAQKISFRRLQVATAFHSEAVSDACEPFEKFLADVKFAAPGVPVFNNTTAEPYPTKAKAMRTMLAQQLAHPVRFADQLRRMQTEGGKIFVEVGAGAVLSGLARQTLGESATIIALNPSGQTADVGLLNGLARLAVAGVPVTWDLLWTGHRLPAPEAKLSAAALPVGAYNLGRPYPPRDGVKTAPVPTPPPVVVAPLSAPGAPKALTAPRPEISRMTEVSAPPPTASPLSSPATRSVASAAKAAVANDAVARAHETFLRAMSDAHRTFLETVSGAPVSASASRAVEPSAARVAPSAKVTAPVVAKAPVRAMSAPPVGRPLAAPVAVVAAVPVRVAAPAPTVAAVVAPVAAPAFDSAKVIQIVLATVAEKTGYPLEMLEPPMQLESDLGIDSIKRVEILSAVQKKLPGLPAVDAKVMGGLQTLEAISNYLVQALGAVAQPVATAAVATPATSANAQVPAFDSAQVNTIVLATVAEKTGYPLEMLEPAMQLESDLGIDSIKRVEILSAVQKKLPGLPAVDAKVMGGLQTLEAISNYLMQALGANAAAAPASVATVAPTKAAAAAPVLAAEAVMPIVLETVAEKTGYPREMLEPGMQLESDLGIDSIKRVEILSAVQKKLPGLPAVDAKVMGGLQTLQAISDYLIQQLGGGANPADAKAKVAATASATMATATSVGSAKATTAELPVLRYLVSAQAAEAPGFALAGLHRLKRLVITDDGRGIAAELRAALAEQHVSAEVVTTVPSDCDGLIVLEGLRSDDRPEAATTAAQAAFAAARAAAVRIAEAGGVFITVQDTGGGYGLGGAPVARAWLGGFAGLAKTAAKEWPRVAVRSLDIECGKQPAQDVARRIADELLFGGDEIEIALNLAGQRRRVVVTEQGLAKAGASRITAKSVVVASGGARGVTASTLVALAGAHQPRIALLGRTALGEEPKECAGVTDEGALRQVLLTREQRAGRQLAPKALAAAVRDVLAQREIRATLERLRAAGSVAEYFACDTTDATSVGATLAQVRGRLGPITALVHGAGVLADKLIAEKTPEQFARVFDTKVRGLQVLLEATANDGLDALVLFSSVAGRFGNRGQCDYAMANEVLNKVAQAEFARRGGRCLVRSINWGPWDGGMVTPALREHFRTQGVGLIAHDEGAAAFVAEFSGAATAAEVEVVVGSGRLDLAADPTQPTHRVEIAVSAERYPFLLDHVVKGKIVVPVALVTEWLLQAAALARPGAALRALRDVQVMKAVFVHEDAAQPTLLELTTRPRADGAVEIRIADPAAGKAHYAAIADYGVGTTARLALPAQNGAGWRDFSFDAAGAYDGRLFHGKEFQVIRELGTWSREAATMTLDNRTLTHAGTEAWKIGPALFDGALQAAVLWSLEAHGKSSLPLRIAELSLTRPARADETVSCQLTGRELAGVGAVSDIDCIDAAGATIFTLRGVECFQVDSYWNPVTT